VQECGNGSNHASQRDFFFRMCFEATILGPMQGRIGGDCLTVKASQDGGVSGHTQIQKPLTRAMVLEKV